MRLSKSWIGGTVGVLIALARPLVWIIDRIGEVDVVHTHLGEVGLFLDSGWGTLTTVLGGCGLIAWSIHFALTKREAHTYSGPINTYVAAAPGYRTGEGEISKTVWLPIRDLFAHIHPQPFRNESEKEEVGRDVIDQISSGQLAVMGRRIEGSKRLALEPIPMENWARAKFTYWFLDKGSEQALHVDCPQDARGSASRQYADLRVNRDQAEEVWSFIPLKDAARMAYEQIRESFLAKTAERMGKTPDGIVKFLANSIYLYHPVYAQRPPSSLRELVPQTLRPSTEVIEGCDGIVEFFDRSMPLYIHPLVMRSDLDAFIEWGKATTLEVEPATNY
jgi:hypothetical protein